LTESVRAVDRALDILLCFSREKPALSLTQIAASIGMSKSTVHRLLATLEKKRFLTRNAGTGKYQLGFRFMELAGQVMDYANESWATPYLEELAEQFGETVDLAILDGAHVIYLRVIESRQRVKIAAAIGQRLPAFCTASGKAFLAYLPAEQVKKFLHAGLTRFTERTLTSQKRLADDLRATRERGFAISQAEFEKDINAVAVPILGMDGKPILAIAIAGPSFRLPYSRMLEIGKALLSLTGRIRSEVGLTTLSMIVPRGNPWQ